MSWLARQGVSPSLATRYRKSGWMDSVGRGAFARRGDTVGWEGAVYALQTEPGTTIHPGGRTALELLGYSHFLRLAPRRAVFLYGGPGERLPKWMRDHDWGADVRLLPSCLRGDNAAHPGLVEHSFGTFALRVSSLERAILELLDGIPDQLPFEEARLVMEGLTTLRPSLLQSLLEACSSIKVKRTFLYLAREARHPWYGLLDKARLDLGKGKRMIARGGRLDAEFMITVPVHDDNDAGHAGDPA
ncbi:MAG: type IV toxin-antitoxin system AbiEi family antitoxin [Rhodocyclaceae bacterium]|nr:type IV toxin-antitoxin system AbiEi family antitoxin [Rhodocyclaceae bacterium]